MTAAPETDGVLLGTIWNDEAFAELLELDIEVSWSGRVIKCGAALNLTVRCGVPAREAR